MKPLRPALKEKKRYVLFSIEGADEFSKTKGKKLVERAVLDYIGVKGLSEAGLVFIDFTDNQGILRVSARKLDDLKASLALVREFEGKELKVDIKFVSGILKKCRAKLG